MSLASFICICVFPSHRMACINSACSSSPKISTCALHSVALSVSICKIEYRFICSCSVYALILSIKVCIKLFSLSLPGSHCLWLEVASPDSSPSSHTDDPASGVLEIISIWLVCTGVVVADTEDPVPIFTALVAPRPSF